MISEVWRNYKCQNRNCKIDGNNGFKFFAVVYKNKLSFTVPIMNAQAFWLFTFLSLFTLVLKLSKNYNIPENHIKQPLLLINSSSENIPFNACDMRLRSGKWQVLENATYRKGLQFGWVSRWNNIFRVFTWKPFILKRKQTLARSKFFVGLFSMVWCFSRKR